MFKLETRSAITPGTAVIDIYVGGAAQAVPRSGDPTNADAVWVFDTANELRHFPLDRHDALITTELGSGETSHSLAVGSAPIIRESLRNVATMDAQDGLGQVRGLGGLAMQRLVSSDNFTRSFEALRDKLLKMHNGDIQNAQLRLWSGLAGGTGSCGTTRAAVHIVDLFREHLNVPVRSDFHFIGGVTAIGLGPRALKNSAAGTADNLVHITDVRCPENEIRTVTIFELPPFGIDRQSRDRCVRELNQAITAPEVVEFLQTNAPNGALSCWLGNTRLIEADYFRSLHPTLEVASQVAADWVQETQRQLDRVQPQPGRVDSIDVDFTRQVLEREEIPDIVERAMASDTQEVIAAILQPGWDLDGRVSAMIRRQERIRLDNVAATFATAPKSLRETRQRLQLLLNLSVAFDEEIDLSVRDYSIAEADVRECRTDATDAVAVLQAPGGWQRLTSGPDQRMMRVHSAAEELRRANDHLDELRTRLDCLRLVRQELARELEFLKSHLDGVIAVLHAFASPLSSFGEQRLLSSKPVDAVWKRLWILASRTSNEQLLTVTAGVDKVTIAGLAAISESPVARLNTIAERLAKSPAKVNGPPTGGKKDPQTAAHFVVLPPLDVDVAAQLVPLIKEFEANVVVAFTAAAGAGVNAVRLRVFEVTGLPDVFSGLMRQSLKAAWKDPLRGLFFPDGNSFEALGIHIGDDVSFGDRRNGADNHGK